MGNRALVVAESSRRRLLIRQYLDNPKQLASVRLQIAFDRQPKLRRGYLELQQIYEVLHDDFGVACTLQELEPFLFALRCTVSRVKLTLGGQNGSRFKLTPAQKAYQPQHEGGRKHRNLNGSNQQDPEGQQQLPKVVLVYSYQPIVSFVSPRELSFYYRSRPEDDIDDEQLDEELDGTECSGSDSYLPSDDGSDIDSAHFEGSQLTIWQAAKTGRVDVLSAICSACAATAPAIFCKSDECDNTPLYYASLCGQESAVDFLLRQYATCGIAVGENELLRCVTNALSVSIRKLLQGKTTLEAIQKQRAAHSQSQSQSQSPVSNGSGSWDEMDDDDDGASLPELFGDANETA